MGFVSGAGIRILSAFFRLMELVSAVVVTGIVGRYLHLAHLSHTHAGSRLIYAEVLGGISILASLLLFFPWKLSYWAFPLDIIMFIMWIVLFGLLAGLSRGCSSSWYQSHWGFLFGGWWRGVSNGNFVPGNGCGRWRTVLAFSFIAAIFWLLSALLGAFKSSQREDRDHRYKRGTERVTETAQPVVSPPVVNRTNNTTQGGVGGPAYSANRDDINTTHGAAREPGYAANTNIGTNQGNLRTDGVSGPDLESNLGTGRTGLGTARDAAGGVPRLC